MMKHWCEIPLCIPLCYLRRLVIVEPGIQIALHSLACNEIFCQFYRYLLTTVILISSCFLPTKISNFCPNQTKSQKNPHKAPVPQVPPSCIAPVPNEYGLHTSKNSLKVCLGEFS